MALYDDCVFYTLRAAELIPHIRTSISCKTGTFHMCSVRDSTSLGMGISQKLSFGSVEELTYARFVNSTSASNLAAAAPESSEVMARGMAS